MKESDNIELRSEKVRNIIGQIPPMLIRFGITLIFFVIIGILAETYFFEYEYTINTTSTIVQHSDTTKIEVKIPANEIEKIKTGQKLIVDFDNIPNLYNQQIKTKIQTIPQKLHIQKTEAFYLAEITLTNSFLAESGKSILITDTITANAKIITEKISFFRRLTEPFLAIFRKK